MLKLKVFFFIFAPVCVYSTLSPINFATFLRPAPLHWPKTKDHEAHNIVGDLYKKEQEFQCDIWYSTCKKQRVIANELHSQNDNLLKAYDSREAIIKQFPPQKAEQLYAKQPCAKQLYEANEEKIASVQKEREKLQRMEKALSTREKNAQKSKFQYENIGYILIYQPELGTKLLGVADHLLGRSCLPEMKDDYAAVQLRGKLRKVDTMKQSWLVLFPKKRYCQKCH